MKKKPSHSLWHGRAFKIIFKTISTTFNVKLEMDLKPNEHFKAEFEAWTASQ